MQRPTRTEDGVITAFRDGCVTLRSNRRTTGFTEAIQEHGYQGVREGDLVIHAMDAFAGAIGVSDADGKSTPVYSVCKPLRGANPYYYALVLRDLSRSGFLASLAKGIRERSTDFRFTDFAELQLPVPSLDEQEQIVRFIRHLDHRVNRLIKAKRRLIELLNEQKQAISHQAVSRGLDPIAHMRPSGVEGLDAIPEHWEVSRVGYLASAITGYAFDSSRMHLEPQGHRLVRGDNVTTEATRWGAKARYWPHSTEELSRFELKVGDVVVGMDGSKVGRNYALISESDLPAYLVQRVTRLRAAGRVWPEYLFRAVASARFYVHTLMLKTDPAVPHITKKDIQTFVVPLPPIAEQERIANYVRERAGLLEDAEARARSEIDLIREYRARLVADVVTGQMDVRQHPWANSELAASESANSVSEDDEEEVEEDDFEN